MTTLVGPNDVGKSAFLRAAWWAVANDPPGTDHIRHGADFAAVHLKLDGEWVQRHRSATENSYTFRDTVYTSLRAPSVPQAIESFLGLTETNFQWQMDAPFWLSESAGSLSKKLNAVVDLTAIDETLDVARSEVGKAKTKVDLAEERLAGLETRLAELDWVEEAGRRLAELDELWQGVEADQGRYQHLDHAATRRAGDLRLEDWGGRVRAACEVAAEAATLAIKAMSDLAWLDAQLAGLEQSRARLHRDWEGPWEELLEARRLGDEAAEAWRTLDAGVRDLETSLEKSCRLESELKDLETRLATETGGRCPACGKATKSSEFLPPTSTCPTPSPEPEPRRGRSGFAPKRS